VSIPLYESALLGSEHGKAKLLLFLHDAISNTIGKNGRLPFQTKIGLESHASTNFDVRVHLGEIDTLFFPFQDSLH
jgi:hypothetical protein